MPPVREASTKPIAATVLPAPVACSNQNRRDAPGSSGCSASCSSSSVLLLLVGRVPVDGLLVLGDLLVALELLLVGGQLLDGDLAVAVAPEPLPFWISARSAISVPDRASTWCAFSVVPSARCGSSSERSRSRPSISEYSRRHSIEGSSRPESISASASSRARRRAVPSASASAGSSPSCTNGSRVNSSARRRSSSVTDGGRATEVSSAMRLWVLRRRERSLARRRTGQTGSSRPVHVTVPKRDGGGAIDLPQKPKARPE